MNLDVVALLKKAASLLSDLVRYTPTELDDVALRLVNLALEIPAIQEFLRELLTSSTIRRLSGVARTTAILDAVALREPECRLIVENWGLGWDDFSKGMPFLTRWLLALCDKR